MASNMALNIILSASLQQLWSMINTQQIIVLMPLFTIKLPPNAGVFFGFIMQIASFDILPTEGFYDKYFNMDDTTAINENFESVGLTSTLFLYNVGSLIVVILSIPLLLFVVLLMKPFRRCSGRINRYHNKLSRYMMWGHPITVMQESYTVALICAMLNVVYPTYETWGDIISTVFAFIVLFLSVLVPLLFGIVLLRKFTYLRRNKIKIRWGAIFEGLRLDRGRIVVLQPMHYFLRRFVLVVVITAQSHIVV
jgi:hypothetical protein